jgi:hypothetical protein
MKYIILQVSHDGDPLMKVPVCFPSVLVHDMVAAQMTALLRMQFFKTDKKTEVEVISAGDFSSTIFMDPEGVCGGESTSIGVKSLGKIDDQLIGMADYGSLML